MTSPSDLALRSYSEGRLMSLRVSRYSWWTHWQELANFFLPRRYRWIITPNMMSRGSPINQHILDSTGCVAARNLAAGLMSGKSSPTRPWLKLRIGKLDSTGTNPASLWLKEVERLMYLIFQESNFYNSMAQFYFDLVIFGTAVVIFYEDFDNVVQCYNPCAGEYYVDIDGSYRPCILYREFTMTISAVVDEFGIENCSENIQQAFKDKDGASLSREIIVAHSIEPNNDGKGKGFGFNDRFAYRECYWEWGGSASPQNTPAKGFLRKKGYYEQPQMTVRWDLVSNDPYGRSVAMDALPDQKQLQLETRRKAQGIDKMVNPPLVADIQLKNQPASLLPGGVTYVSGYAASGKPGFSSVYDTKFPINDMVTELEEVRGRLKKTFFNDLFQTASQFETRSNITAVEWDMRKAESMVMLGPVIERIDHEGLKVAVNRVYGIASRAGVIPPPPPEIAGMNIEIEFVSMLARAQSAAEASGIERLLGMAGNLVGVTGPEIMDKIDTDFSLDKYSSLMNNDPRLMRSDDVVAQMRENRANAQKQQQQVEMAEKLAKGAKNLAGVDVGGGQNAIQAMTGTAPNV